MNARERASVVDGLIPRAPDDVAPLREAFAAMVSQQWEKHLPSVADYRGPVKARFIAEMYARACYSMLPLSALIPIISMNFISVSFRFAHFSALSQ